MKLHVVGAGLIGTSVGLALRGHAEVLLSDAVEEHLETAVRRGAGRRWDGQEHADLLLVCVPPDRTPDVIIDALERDLAPTVSHVASAQSAVQREVETRSQGRDVQVCGGHPLAGRERGGPLAATGRLFVDRPWVVCPAARSAPAAVEAVLELARACGAVPVLATADQHDAAVALMSHLPQIAASAVAARLHACSAGAGLDPLRLAGPGVQDTTRVAASEPDLWVDVLQRNAAHVSPLVRALAADLAAVADALDVLAAGPDSGASASVRDLLERGRAGRERLPLKQGTAVRHLTEVSVSVSDSPGQLAAVLVAAAEAQVNVEDVRVEHLPGRPRGVVELLVPAADAGHARRTLAAGGWDVLDPL